MGMMLYKLSNSEYAYINNGSGWVLNNQFAPPDNFTTNARADNGIKIILIPD